MKKAPGNMKVICIKQGQWSDLGLGKSGLGTKGPKYGDECTVVGENNSYMDFPAYLLKEWPYEGGWLKKWFIPLSTLDETTLSRNYQKEPQL